MENNHQQQQFSNKICNKLTFVTGHWKKRQKLVKCAILLSLGYGHGTFPDLKPILLCFLQCLLADKNAIQHVKPTQRLLMVLFFDIQYNLINSGKKQLNIVYFQPDGSSEVKQAQIYTLYCSEQHQHKRCQNAIII